MTLSRKTPLTRTAFKRSEIVTERKPATGKPKMKKCAHRSCRAPYEPDPKQPFKVWCSAECGAAIGLEKLAKQKAAKQKAERAEDKRKRDGMKSIPELKSEAQTVFNRYVRERDLKAGHGCICCGKFASWEALGQPGGAYDACHYRSRGSADHLRFDERNVHLGLKDCNTYGHQDYRGGLIRRIGLEAVEALESDNTGRKWTREYLEEVKRTYQQKLRDLKNATE